MKNLLLLPFAFFAIQGSAQSAQVSVDGNGRAITVPENYVMFVNTVKSDNLTGSPLFSEEWLKGDVFFQGNRVSRNIPLQIDLEKNLVYFQQNGNTYQFIAPVVKCVLQRNTNGETETIIFSSDYPAYRSETPGRLYHVIAQTNTVHLLKYHSKRIRETYVYNMPAKLEYVAREEFFVYSSVTKRLHAVSNKKSFLTAFPDQHTAIETLCKQNGWKLQTEEEMLKLVQQLNL